MNTRIGMALALALAISTAGAAEKKAEVSATDTQTPKKQTVCPVMGGPIKTTQYADFEGKRIYFCCGGCIASFKKDPAKYLAKLEKAGVTPEKAPAAKPEKKKE